jgi:CheY-like chemotaxis protein
MKTHNILIGNCEELLNDFIEALFHEVCDGQAAVHCTRTARVGDFIRQGCDAQFDLLIQVPHNLFPELSAPTPMGLIGEGIRAIRTIKSKRPAPVIAILALEERARYEALLLEAGADCVLELPFEGDELTSAVGRLLKFPARLQHPPSARWFFAGVLMRGLRRLSQA